MNPAGPALAWTPADLALAWTLAGLARNPAGLL